MIASLDTGTLLAIAGGAIAIIGVCWLACRLFIAAIERGREGHDDE